MRTKPGKPKTPPPIESPPKADDTLVVLAVGEVGVWHESGRSLPPEKFVTCVEFKNVCGDLLSSLQPDMVLSPVLCSGFDCVDLAHLLQRHGFSGRYRAVMPDTLNPCVVRDEVQASCPKIDFDIVSFAKQSRERLH